MMIWQIANLRMGVKIFPITEVKAIGQNDAGLDGLLCQVLVST